MAESRLPLWLARIKAGNLLQTVAKYEDFPLVAETYREIFQDYLVLEALRAVLQGIRAGEIEIYRKPRQGPSPFAHGHLFNFVAGFMYDTDTPKVEGGKRLFGLGPETLKTIVGQSGFRELFRTDIIKEVDRKARGIDFVAKNLNEERVRYWLERCGDLTDLEIDEAFPQRGEEAWAILTALQAKGLAVLVEAEPKARLKVNPKTDSKTNPEADSKANYGTDAGGGETGWRWLINRDELETYLTLLPGAKVGEGTAAGAEKVSGNGADGMSSFPSAPTAYREAKARIIQRYVRTHDPFTARESAARYGLALSEVDEELAVLASVGLAEAGEYLPNGEGEEWCDPEILREIHRRSFVRRRQEIKACTCLREPEEYAVFLARWQGVTGGETKRKDWLKP